MGSQERRERERLQQRQKILNAALAIITKEGFAALSMRKLAEQIEYSTASIYLYFKNREQLAQELSERGFQELLDALTVGVSGKQGTAALDALGAAYVAYGLAHPEMYRLIFMGDSEYMTAAYAAKRPDSAAARAYGVLLEMAHQLNDGRGISDAGKLTTIAEMIGCALHGIVSLRITCAASLTSSPEALVSLATETLARGLLDGKSAHASNSPRRLTKSALKSSTANQG